MPKVTGLDLDGRSGGVRVALDGQVFATIALQDVQDLKLEVGAPLDGVRHADLGRRADVFGARLVALRILGARAVPSREIVRRLVRKGHRREAAEAAVAALVATGLVNDAEIARHFVRTRVRQRRLGPARLAADLRRMGVEEDQAERAVGEAIAQEGVDLRALVREAAAKKLRALRGLDRRTAGRRLRAFLRRRGFPSADVVAVVKEALGG
jgi:regulatory protein